MNVRDDLAFVREAMAAGVLVSREVCWTLGPLLDLLERLLDERDQEANHNREVPSNGEETPQDPEDEAPDV